MISYYQGCPFIAQVVRAGDGDGAAKAREDLSFILDASL